MFHGLGEPSVQQCSSFIYEEVLYWANGKLLDGISASMRLG
jgi:hypothetical protein